MRRFRCPHCGRFYRKQKGVDKHVHNAHAFVRYHRMDIPVTAGYVYDTYVTANSLALPTHQLAADQRRFLANRLLRQASVGSWASVSWIDWSDYVPECTADSYDT